MPMISHQAPGQNPRRVSRLCLDQHPLESLIISRLPKQWKTSNRNVGQVVLSPQGERLTCLHHLRPRFFTLTLTLMPTYIRWREQGATYFFTLVTYRRQRILTGTLCRQLLGNAIRSVQQRHPFEILAIVLLPDHLHCIWTLPDDDDDFPTRWRQIKSKFTHDYLARGGRDWETTAQSQRQGRRGVWQPRYYEHRIRDEEDYLRHRDYIHLNPVKHELVEKPEDWPWSSFHRHVRLGWLDPEWPGSSAVVLPAIETRRRIEGM